MPPGFWSLTTYDSVTDLTVPNPINRYALGSDNDLKKNADGSITIYLQHDNPGRDPLMLFGFGMATRLEHHRDDSLHDLAVEMPVRVCEDRQHEREANERQQEAEHQGRCDDQSPQRHRERVRQHCFD